MASHSMTRRELLRGTASALAFPYVITGAALGNGAKAAASERVTLGHIGVGNQGSYLFKQFQGVKDAQSVAVADAYKDRRELRAVQCGGKAYADFREILGRDDIDAVIVATPDHWHVPIAVMAARAGKDCYVEKPLGLSVEQDLACRKVFDEHNRVFQYGTQQRSSEHCRIGCELVRSGRIGKIRELEVLAPNGGSGGSTQEVAVPPGFDYETWLGPAPVKPYTADRCHPAGDVLDLRPFDRLPRRLGRPPAGHPGLGLRRRPGRAVDRRGDRQGARHRPVRHGLRLGHEDHVRRPA